MRFSAVFGYALSAVSLLTVVNAATHGSLVKFIMSDKEIEGEYYDYVDGDGFRHVSFGAVLPIDEENFAVIYNVDAPQGKNVRVITEETDADFINRLRLYREADRAACYKTEQTELSEDFTFTVSECSAYPEPEDFGLVFKDSELCLYKCDFVTKEDFSGGGEDTLGRKFMYIGAAEGKPSGSGSDDAPSKYTYDWENEIKVFKHSFYYYVGKE